MSGHMADAGGEVVAANGFGTRIIMLDKDVRRMDVVRQFRLVDEVCFDIGGCSHLRGAVSFCPEDSKAKGFEDQEL